MRPWNAEVNVSVQFELLFMLEWMEIVSREGNMRKGGRWTWHRYSIDKIGAWGSDRRDIYAHAVAYIFLLPHPLLPVNMYMYISFVPDR